MTVQHFFKDKINSEPFYPVFHRTIQRISFFLLLNIFLALTL